MRAARHLQAGEQLLIEYDESMGEQPLEVRRNRMRTWLIGLCICMFEA